jgi:hypothetical protein
MSFTHLNKVIMTCSQRSRAGSCKKKKQEEIREFIGVNQSEIESGRLVFLFLDACHLCWGDVCGYGWGRSDMRVEIPMANERRRQTHFGALNDQTKEFILRE